MSANNKTNVLSEAFIEDLFVTCIEDSYILSMVCEHLEEEHLPDRNTAAVLKAFKDYYREYRRVPNYSIIQQKLAGKMVLSDFGRKPMITVKRLPLMNVLACSKNT